MPGKLCRWDGWEWTYVDCPIEFERIYGSSVDNLGDLVLETGPRYDQITWNVIAPDGSVEGFEDPRDAVEELVRRGATRVIHAKTKHPFTILDGGRILIHGLGRNHEYDLQYFDGTAWFPMSARQTWSKKVGDVMGSEGLDAFFTPSDTHGFIYRSGLGHGQNALYFTVEDEELVPVFSKGPWHYMLGPRGVQPYEKSMVLGQPDRYVPVRFHEAYSYLVPDVAGFAQYMQTGDPGTGPQYELRADAWTVPSRVAGCWVAPSAIRVLGSEVLTVQLEPIRRDWRAPVQDIFEDRSGKTWFVALPRAFVCDVSALRIEPGEIPTETGRRWQPEVKVLPEVAAARVRILSRVDDGPWEAGEPGEIPVLRFQEDGPRDVTLAVMDVSGVVSPSTAAFHIDASVQHPDTILAAGGKIRAREPFWEPPVTVEPSAASGEISLAWRMDDGSWINSDGMEVSFAGIEPGTHEVQVAAVEDGFWRDPSPVEFEVRYEPDYTFFIERLLDELGSDDPETVERAKEKIKLAGKPVLPALEETIERMKRRRDLSNQLRYVLPRLHQQFPRENEAPRGP
jgi:hypothetical protein